MSFDVYVEVEGDDDEGSQRWANYTSNMGAFFAWALDGTEFVDPTARCDSRDAILGAGPADGLITLNRLAAPEAAARLRSALARIDVTASRDLRRFDATNGWGDWESATEFLRKLHRFCVEAPTGKVRITR